MTTPHPLLSALSRATADAKGSDVALPAGYGALVFDRKALAHVLSRAVTLSRSEPSRVYLGSETPGGAYRPTVLIDIGPARITLRGRTFLGDLSERAAAVAVLPDVLTDAIPVRHDPKPAKTPRALQRAQPVAIATTEDTMARPSLSDLANTTPAPAAAPSRLAAPVAPKPVAKPAPVAQAPSWTTVDTAPSERPSPVQAPKPAPVVAVVPPPSEPARTGFHTTIDTYKGHPLLRVWDGEDNVLTFGGRKARALLACLGDLQAFVGELDRASKGKVG
jgi:hypothetical protein